MHREHQVVQPTCSSRLFAKRATHTQDGRGDEVEQPQLSLDSLGHDEDDEEADGKDGEKDPEGLLSGLVDVNDVVGRVRSRRALGVRRRERAVRGVVAMVVGVSTGGLGTLGNGDRGGVVMPGLGDGQRAGNGLVEEVHVWRCEDLAKGWSLNRIGPSGTGREREGGSMRLDSYILASKRSGSRVMGSDGRLAKPGSGRAMTGGGRASHHDDMDASHGYTRIQRASGSRCVSSHRPCAMQFVS